MTRARTTSPMTRNQRRRSSDIPSKVKLRKVVPEVPQSETERGELLEDLQTMGCSGLLEKPWDFKHDQIVRELLDGVSNEFKHSIRASPIRWTEECWREVYNFSKGGGGMAGRKDEYVKDCFRALPSPKDGYAIEDCTDVRHRHVLAFLVPILYPEKPNRVTVTLGNMIFGALNGGRKVNWARIITNLVVQLVARVRKSRASPICPFLYHLYERKELLWVEEEKSWKIQEAMMKYGKSGSLDEDRSGSGSDDETEEEEEEECQVILNRNPSKRQRQEEKQLQENVPLIPKVERIPDTSSKDRFEHICKVLGEIHAEHRMRGELVREACQLANYTPSDLPDQIRKMVVEQFRVEDSKRLIEENARLNLEVGALINENRTARMQAEAAVAAAEKIWMFANQAGEVVAKAELFDEKVGIGSKPSGARIALILTNYSEKLEGVSGEMREVVKQITDLRKQLERPDLGASCSKGVPHLSNLSLPETFNGILSMEELVDMDVTPESKIGSGPTHSRKGKSPVKKNRDEIMTSASKGESESGTGDFPIPDLHQRQRMESRSPDQETAGFVTPRISK
jgi:hypothetical protein